MGAIYQAFAILPKATFLWRSSNNIRSSLYRNFNSMDYAIKQLTTGNTIGSVRNDYQISDSNSALWVENNVLKFYDGQTTRTLETSGFLYPQLSNGKAVWIKNVNELRPGFSAPFPTPHVFLFDGSTTTDLGSALSSSGNGTDVTIEGDRVAFATDAGINLYNISTGARSIVPGSPTGSVNGSQSKVASIKLDPASDAVIWHELNTTKEVVGFSFQIYDALKIYNGDRIINIATTELGGGTAPVKAEIYNKRVIFENLRSVSASDILLYDNGTTSTVAANLITRVDPYGGSFGLDETKVFFESGQALQEYDIATGTIATVVSGLPIPQSSYGNSSYRAWQASSSSGNTLILSDGSTQNTIATSNLSTLFDPALAADGSVLFIDGGNLYLASNSSNLSPIINQAPVVVNAIADRTTTVGTVFSLVVTADAFSDPENDPLTYSASQSNNLPLPVWLSFDPATLTFSGTPSVGNEGTLELQVRATDASGNNVSNIFQLTVDSTGGVTNPPTTGIRRITQAPDGTGSDGDSENMAISNDGRYVVYSSKASNLVDSDPNGGGSAGRDIFLFDRETNTNTRIAEGFSTDISGNGRYITYEDKILDRDTNTTTTFVKALNGATPISPFGSVGGNATISDDGRFIAYYSHATNLVSDDTNDNSDIFLYDRENDTTIKVSSGAGFATVPQISGDGNFIVYGQDEDSVYLYDRIAGTNTKISPDDFGTANIQRARISKDNRYITFGNLGAVNKTLKYDRTTGTITEGDPDLLYNLVISDDGNYQVRLAQDSENLIPNDNNGFADLFLSATGNNNNSGGGGNNGGGTGSTSISGLSLTGNLFQTDATFKGFGVTPIGQKNTQKVSEIVLFSVDDLAGNIGGIALGQAGYLAAALQNAKTIFSTLGDSFFSTETRELSLDPNKIYQVIEIVDGSLLEAQQQLASGITPSNLLFSLPDSSGNSSIAIDDTANGYSISINNDELILSIDALTGQTVNTPIGAKSQSLAEGRTIDLSDYVGQTLKADILTNSSAAYNNQIGFYAVEDAIGTIALADGSTLKPGDADYAVEAIKLALTNSLQAGKNETIVDRDIIGGKIYAPVVVTQGTLNDFIGQNPTNGGGADDIHAYFNYFGANPDRVDHFRLLGNNTFGVEDLYGGGDRDFNDLVISMNLQV
jgi:hypothetical protein